MQHWKSLLPTCIIILYVVRHAIDQLQLCIYQAVISKVITSLVISVAKWQWKVALSRTGLASSHTNSYTSKEKEQAIKKQYNDTVKIQHRQYRALEEQIKLAVPRDRHKEVIRQTREERMRKISMLAMQYERTISDMAQQKTVRHNTMHTV